MEQDKSVDMKKVERTLKNKGMDDSSTDLSESLSDLLNHMTEDEAIYLLSDLSLFEIQKLVAISTVGKKNPVMKQFVEDYASMKVSHKRRGRKELVKIADAFSGIFQMEQGGITEKLKGMVR